jgi:hypothetical protein
MYIYVSVADLACARFGRQRQSLLRAPKRLSDSPAQATAELNFLVLTLPQVLYCASELLSPQQFLDEIQAAGRAMPA